MLFADILFCAVGAIQGCTPLWRGRGKNSGSIPLCIPILCYCLLCAKWFCKFVIKEPLHPQPEILCIFSSITSSSVVISFYYMLVRKQS